MLVKENTPKAIILILIGMSAVTLQDILIKLLTSEINIFLLLLCRASLGLIFLLIFLKIKKEPIIFKTKYPVLTIIRVLLFYTAFILYFFSLTKLSLATAVTLFFVSPFLLQFCQFFFLMKLLVLEDGSLLL